MSERSKAVYCSWSLRFPPIRFWEEYFKSSFLLLEELNLMHLSEPFY